MALINGTGGNDTLVGTDLPDTINGFNGADILYGYKGSGASHPVNAPPVSVAGGGGNIDHDVINGGNGNDTIHAGGGNDTINAGNGDDTVNAGNGNDIVDGGNGNDLIDASEGNDTINGKNGNDILVGDLFNNGVGQPDIIIECEAGVGEEFDPLTPGGDNQNHASHNDVLDDGAGSDIVVGDAYVLGFGDLMLNALAGTGGFMGGAGGNDNSVLCFSDTFVPGAGNDLIVGDVYYTVGFGDVELNAAAGSSGQGRFAFSPHGPGGNGGDLNIVMAFNDTMSDEVPSAGNDLMVGDVLGQNTAGVDDMLNALAGAGGKDGGDGGDNNLVVAFNDLLNGGTGSDLIVGDNYRVSGTGDIELNAFAGSGGDGAGGGAGGNHNTVVAFNDLLNGGTGGDLIVGDVYQGGDAGNDVLISIKSGHPASGNGGNSVSAFNDRLLGGTGDDFLIGDAYHPGDPENVRVTIDSYAGPNAIHAFQDVLDGGFGSDFLVGDFLADPGSDPAQLTIIGSFTGQDRLFADTLDGGAGSDHLIGGLGADTMTGGTGRDLFDYRAGDLFDMLGGVAQGTPPVDVITDFVGNNTDLIDLSDLLASLGFNKPVHNITDWLDYTFVAGGAGTISIDQDGAASNYLPMLTLSGFTTGVNINAMIMNGELNV